MTGTPSATGTTVPRGVASLALATLTLLVATSCTTKPAGPAPASASSAPSAPVASSTTNAEEEEARKQVLAAYDGYRQAHIAAAAIPDTTGGKIRDYTADPLLALLKADLRMSAEQGYVLKGKPTWTVKVVKVNVTQRPFTVETEECLDTTNWKAVSRSTGKPLAVPEQNLKYLVIGEAALFDDGRWLIRRNESQRDRPC